LGGGLFGLAKVFVTLDPLIILRVQGNPNGIPSNPLRRYKYTKVPANRKHPIRGLWRHHGKHLVLYPLNNYSFCNLRRSSS